jgi:hypothetical protein
VDSTDHVFCNKNCYEDIKEGRRRKVTTTNHFLSNQQTAEESEDDDERMKNID